MQKSKKGSEKQQIIQRLIVSNKTDLLKNKSVFLFIPTIQGIQKGLDLHKSLVVRIKIKKYIDDRLKPEQIGAWVEVCRDRSPADSSNILCVDRGWAEADVLAVAIGKAGFVVKDPAHTPKRE